MGEYEPRDSRIVTQSTHRAPGEPERTGPRESETRQPQGEETQQGELTEDLRGEDPEATVAAEQQQEQAQPSPGAGEPGRTASDGEGPERFDRND